MSEIALSFSIRKAAKTLFANGIRSTALYPHWGIIHDDIDYLALKGIASSLTIPPPVIKDNLLVFNAYLSLSNGKTLPCPISALTLHGTPQVPITLCDAFPPACHPLSSSFRIACGTIAEKGALRTWHTSSSYWVKPRR